MERVQVAKPTDEGFVKFGKRRVETKRTNVPITNKDKVQRNDPCPCGSGKKYKKCCGAANNSSGE